MKKSIVLMVALLSCGALTLQGSPYASARHLWIVNRMVAFGGDVPGSLTGVWVTVRDADGEKLHTSGGKSLTPLPGNNATRVAVAPEETISITAGRRKSFDVIDQEIIEKSKNITREGDVVLYEINYKDKMRGWDFTITPYTEQEAMRVYPWYTGNYTTGEHYPIQVKQ